MAKMNQVHGATRSTMDSDRHSMGLHGESIEVIMTMLTNLYADPVSAVIREYAVNAIDSHIEAGNSEPIIVNLPSAMRPTFTIQDFGIGLTTQEVIDLFGLYGNSTKRDSNAVTGMLGVGSKSGLTYSNSFTVTAVKNGVQTTALVSKNDRGIGQIDIVDTAKTDKRNGVTIQIPVAVRDISSFADKAQGFFSYWSVGEYLLDGKTVKAAHDGMTKAGNLPVYIGSSGYYTKKVVVMGHVPYAVNSDLLDDVLGRNAFIAYLNIGEVQFAPSREELMYSNMTNKTLANLAQAVRNQAQATVNNILAKCQTKKEAYQAKQDHINSDFFARYADWNWNGWTIPDTVTSLRDAKHTAREFTMRRNGSDFVGADYGNASEGSSVGENCFVVNNAPKVIPNWMKEGIRDKVIGKLDGMKPSDDARSVWVTFYPGDLTTEENFDFLPVVEFSKISKIVPKPAKTSVNGVAIDKTSHNFEVITFSSNNRYNPSTCRRNYTGRYVTDLTDADKARFLIAPAQDNDVEWLKTQAYAQASETKTYIVQVNKRSQDEFVNAGYTLTDLATLKKEADARIARVTKDDCLAYLVSQYAPEWVQRFAEIADDTEWLDPDVVAVVEFYQEAVKKGALVGTMTYDDRQRAFVKHGVNKGNWYWREDAIKGLPGCSKIHSRYKVLSISDNYNIEVRSLTEGINALYTYRKENS